MTQRGVSYTEFPYPRLVFPRTHPAYLGTLGRLMALDAAPADRCRVLELGCARGANLIPMAFGLPASAFVGVDLSEPQIADAQCVVADLDLRNITFHAADLMDLGPELGTFDYVVAHGLYSWVPAAVRDKLLALCGDVLTPHGVAYVSYKTYPGGHVADMIRQMGLYHLQSVEAAQWPRRMGELIQFLRKGVPEKHTAYRAAVLEYTERLLREPPGSLLHDDLEADSDPVYFHEFAAHAERHGLQYLGEAEFPSMCGAGIPAEAMERIRATDDLLEFEQYLDLLYGRGFRSTLLCRKHAALDRRLTVERLADLYIVPELRAETSAGVNDSQRFRTAYGVLEVTDPITKIALAHLACKRSQATSLPALLSAIRDDAESTLTESARVELTLERLGQRVLDWYATGAVELCTWAPRFVSEVTRRPVASPLVRYEASRGWDVSSLTHRRVALADPLARRTLALLDGKHDRDQLVRKLLPSVLSAEVGGGRDPRQVHGRAELAAALRKQIDAYLHEFARQALLVG